MLLALASDFFGSAFGAGSFSGSVLHDIFSGIRVVKAYRTERKEEARYDDAISKERDIEMKNEMIFVVPANSEIKSMDDLKGKTVGVQTGSTAQEIL